MSDHNRSTSPTSAKEKAAAEKQARLEKAAGEFTQTQRCAAHPRRSGPRCDQEQKPDDRLDTPSRVCANLGSQNAHLALAL